MTEDIDSSRVFIDLKGKDKKIVEETIFPCWVVRPVEDILVFIHTPLEAILIGEQCVACESAQARYAVTRIGSRKDTISLIEGTIIGGTLDGSVCSKMCGLQHFFNVTVAAGQKAEADKIAREARMEERAQADLESELNGYIAPDGAFHRCIVWGHQKLAEQLCAQYKYEGPSWEHYLDKLGWIRMSGGNFQFDKITEPQEVWIRDWHHRHNYKINSELEERFNKL